MHLGNIPLKRCFESQFDFNVVCALFIIICQTIRKLQCLYYLKSKSEMLLRYANVEAEKRCGILHCIIM